MSTSTANSALLPPPLPATGEHAHHERTIQRQLARTSFLVRLVDLAASFAGLLIGVLAFLLLVACVDHWVVPLGWVGRTLALVALVGGTLAYLVLQVGPLLVRAINPTYAARTIEEVTPTLKNSLINFLLLRQDRSGVKEVVFEAVEAKAAADIATVRVENIVDRSRLIYAGYVLCGVMAVFAAYKILSPKDPFQTIARVVLPWADIARPSRVQISDVLPGDAEVYHGQVVAVSAIVSGVREGDPVTLLYSTADGQTVDRRVEMALSAGGLRYECRLPAESQEAGVGGRESGVGIQQNLTYHIVAGDAQSPDYTLAVVAAPTIIVEKLDYQFPAYTKKPPQTVPQQGDIHALEGTRVTIHAVSNQPIKSAYLELDPGLKDVPPELLPLAAEGTRARGTLTLQLKADKQTPWHASYQVRFYNERGQRSQQPILHKIEVIRDLPPEVQILQPQKVRVEVPLDGEQTIEVRGVDPDFGLSSLRLEGTVGGDRVLNFELLDAQTSQPPQAIVPFVFRPRQHKLAVGDELKYAAIAADNRASPQTAQPEPNFARTAEYTLVVVAPRNGGQGDRGQGTGDKGPDTPARSASEGAPPNQPNPGENPQPNKPRDGSEGNSSSKPSESGGTQQPMPGESSSKPESSSSQSAQPEKSQSGNQQSGSQQSGNQQSGNQQSGSQSGQQNQGSSGSQNQGQGASSQGSGGAGSQAGSPQSGSPMNEDGSQAGTGQGSASGKPSSNSQQPSGQQGDAPADATGTPSGSGGKPEKAHEGQLVEELVKQLQKEQGQPGQGGQKSGDGSQASGDKGQESGDKGQESGDKGQESGDKGQPNGGKPSQGNDTQARSASEGTPSAKPENAPPGNATEGMPPSNGEQGTPSQGAKGQPNQGASSGQPSGNSPASAGQPGANDQKPQPGQPPQSQGDKTDPKNRLPDDQQGQNPSQQPGSGNSGGAPQGPSKTDQGKESSQSQGEKRDPGAGQNGTEGAGSKSADKTGSGQGQEANRDKPKSQQPESGSAQQGEPSPPSGSKRQSDSQGGQSGDQSGGGKQGAGQSAGQEGNDSAGSKSAADQGAGAANQTGSGETGSKAGGKEQSSGKTGQSGDQAGDGTQSRSASEGKPGDGASKENKNSKGDGTSKQPGNSAGGSVVNGGGDGNRPETNYGKTPEAEAADAANLEYARQATDLALSKLRDQEHDPDPALLEKLGWSKDDLAEFLRRWDGLKKSANESPDGKRELDEALKSLGLRNPANRQRAGGAASDNQRDLRDSGDRTAPPANYRDLFDAFRKGASRSAK